MTAYALRYWYEQVQKDGRIVRLEMLEKEGTSPAMEIGPVVQELRLDIQGQTEDIDTPIVKTSLTMTFVDAPDHEEAGTKKCGEWIEFYTPDSTAWMVRLYVSNDDDRYDEIWSGFITPDSYSEQLRYRGSVTVVVRDNIGHMQDFMFDPDDFVDLDMVSFYNLVTMGADKAGVLMSLSFGEESQHLECNGTADYSAKFNKSAFEGMNYYDAIEKVLYSFGMVMRYVGNNKIVICPLRYLPYFGNTDIANVKTYVPVFEAYATRELAPAVKKIEESVNYEIEDELQMPLVKDNFTGDIIDTVLTETTGTQFHIYDWQIYSMDGWRATDKPIYFNPRGYDSSQVAEEKDLAGMWLSNTAFLGAGPLRYAEYVRIVHCTRLSVNLQFGRVYRLADNVLKEVTTSRASYVQLGIFATYSGQIYWMTKGGEWTTTETMLKYECDDQENVSIVVYSDAFDGSVELGMRIYYVNAESWDYAAYIPIQSLLFAPEMSLREKNTVNTIYDERNNIILTRQPEFGPAYDNVFLPDVIKNGIFIQAEEEGEYLPAREWKWCDSDTEVDSEPMQLAAYNHMQLLCYHSKPNNVISGTIVNADVTNPAGLFKWRNEDHILVSGSLNYLSGFIEGAVLRGFTLYKMMWLPHTDVDYIEIGYEGGDVVVQFFAKDNVSWNVITPLWIEADKTSGTGPADITLSIRSSRIGREGEVKIGPAVVKVVQKAVGHFNTDYNDDFKVFRDFNEDYYMGDIN